MKPSLLLGLNRSLCLQPVCTDKVYYSQVPNIKRFLILLLAFTGTASVFGQATEPSKPLTVEGIRRWQSTGALDDWKQWPHEIKLDICGDDQPELFLAIGAFSRGMSYAVFTRQGSSWRLLADEVDCTAGMVDVLDAQHDGYYDFAAFQRSGRGGFFVRVYSWDGHHYAEKANWEMRKDELYNHQ